MTDLMRLLIALATLQQTFEDLYLRGDLAAERPWAITRADVPLRRLFDVLFSERGLTLLLASRVVAGVALILTPQPIDVIILMLGTWLWAVRWRGTFNGGSDQMTMVVLIGLLIAMLNPAFEFAGQAFVAANLIFSFVTAGFVKIKNRDWRRGVAPVTFLSDAGAGRLPTPIAITLAWSTMAFELLFPLTLAHPIFAIVGTVGGAIFHLANAYWFGLNRFLFAWAAAYPALLAVSRTFG